MANIKTEISETNSFDRGWGLVANKDTDAVMQKIMTVLHIGSKQMFHYRRRGTVAHKPTERKAIEGVFAEFGISKRKVWGTDIKEPA